MSILFRSPRADAAVDPAIHAALDSQLDDDALIDPATAAELREQAAHARRHAEQARSDADTVLTEAREQARALLAGGEARARALTATAKAAEVDAAALEERAATIAGAREALCRAETAERQADELAAEYARLTNRISDLEARLVEFGRSREDSAVAHATAREEADVDSVTRERTRMAAIDDVVATLTGQVQTARARAQAIGEAGWGGEFDRALAVAADWRTQLDDALNVLDPGRPDRLAVAQTIEYAKALTVSGVPEDQATATAALIVAMARHPEAVDAYFGTGT